MKAQQLPGLLPSTPPPAGTQHRLTTYHPYVREAVDSVREPWSLKPRKLLDYLLVHQVEGESRFCIEGSRFETKPGDVVWIPPDTLHEMRSSCPRTRYQYIHLDLVYDPARSHWSANIPGGTEDLSPWHELIHPPLNDPDIERWRGKLHGFSSSHVSELLRRIIIEFDRAQSSTLVVSGLVLQLIGHLLGSTERGSQLSSQHTRTIENAMQHIQRNSHDKLHIERLAHQYGLSPTHFRKLFREYYRQSPREAHLHAKMRAACDYLIYSNLSISEIADRLGFSNVHNFSRAFSKAIGKPPSIYRHGTTATRTAAQA